MAPAPCAGNPSPFESDFVTAIPPLASELEAFSPAVKSLKLEVSLPLCMVMGAG